MDITLRKVISGRVVRDIWALKIDFNPEFENLIFDKLGYFVRFRYHLHCFLYQGSTSHLDRNPVIGWLNTAVYGSLDFWFYWRIGFFIQVLKMKWISPLIFDLLWKSFIYIKKSRKVVYHFTANECCETFSVCFQTFPVWFGTRPFCSETRGNFFPDRCETFLFCCEIFPSCYESYLLPNRIECWQGFKWSIRVDMFSWTSKGSMSGRFGSSWTAKDVSEHGIAIC